MWASLYGTDCCSMRTVLSGGEISHHIVNGARNSNVSLRPEFIKLVKCDGGGWEALERNSVR